MCANDCSIQPEQTSPAKSVSDKPIRECSSALLFAMTSLFPSISAHESRVPAKYLTIRLTCCQCRYSGDYGPCPDVSDSRRSCHSCCLALQATVCHETLVRFPSMPGSLGSVHKTHGTVQVLPGFRSARCSSDCPSAFEWSSVCVICGQSLIPRAFRTLHDFLVVAFRQLKPSARWSCSFVLPRCQSLSMFLCFCGSVPPPSLQMEPNRWCRPHQATLGMRCVIPGINTSTLTGSTTR